MTRQFADRRLPSTERRIIQRPKETCEVVHTGPKIDFAAENIIGSKPERGAIRSAAIRVMAQAGDAAPGRVVGALKDLVGRHLDPLAFGDDPIATAGVRLVVGYLTIARR